MLFAYFFLQGWMNEIQNYNPETYHATLTHSVFVRLEGSTLRISKPNKNIARRASYNESKPDITYISQKIYDLTDSKVCVCVWNEALNFSYAKHCIESPTWWDVKNIQFSINYINTTATHEHWLLLLHFWTRAIKFFAVLKKNISGFPARGDCEGKC